MAPRSGFDLLCINTAMTTYTCLDCNKIFNSPLALAGHKRMHGPSDGKINKIFCSCILTKKIMPHQDLGKYQKTLKNCKQCIVLFHPTKNRKSFCSQSCSATFNNLHRPNRSINTKLKISDALTRFHNKNTKAKQSVGEHSKLFLCTCKHCDEKFVSRIKKKYCRDHRTLYKESSKAGYKFTFNVFHYPDLFDLTLIKTFGWFSPGGKAGKWNINGISRDHKISVNEAIANNYDPYYITHPLNCELMVHSENNKKKTNSSITYPELKKLVQEYDVKNK